MVAVEVAATKTTETGELTISQNQPGAACGDVDSIGVAGRARVVGAGERVVHKKGVCAGTGEFVTAHDGARGLTATRL